MVGEFLAQVEKGNVTEVECILRREERRRQEELKTDVMCRTCKLNVHSLDINGDTCLHIAVRRGDLSMLSCLLSSPMIDPSCANKSGLQAHEIYITGYPGRFSKSKFQRLLSQARRLFQEAHARRFRESLPLKSLILAMKDNSINLQLIRVAYSCEHCSII